MVSLARHVRANGAHELTRNRLEQLRQLLQRLDDGSTSIPALRLDPNLPLTEDQLRLRAGESMLELGRLAERSQTSILPALGDPTAFDPASLRDAWGLPIALLAGPHPAIGLPPDGGAFFVSAGPDRLYLTLLDNLYSYDLPAREESTTRPDGVDNANNSGR